MSKFSPRPTPHAPHPTLGIKWDAPKYSTGALVLQ